MQVMIPREMGGDGEVYSCAVTMVLLAKVKKALERTGQGTGQPGRG